MKASASWTRLVKRSRVSGRYSTICCLQPDQTKTNCDHCSTTLPTTALPSLPLPLFAARPKLPCCLFIPLLFAQPILHTRPAASFGFPGQHRTYHKTSRQVRELSDKLNWV